MPGAVSVRVTVLDTWDEAFLNLSPATPISELKRAALTHARIRRSPGEYLVKYRGAELDEAGRTLADAGITQNASLIVMPRRRRPAK